MTFVPHEYVAGDHSAEVAAAKTKLEKFSYGKDLPPGDEATAAFLAALHTFKVNVHNAVLAHRMDAPDVNPASSSIDWATQKQLGILPATVRPKPAPARGRHPAIVFRGTGGVIGADYVSRICQGAADLVEEINPVFAATMGGLPVGTAGSIADPSMEHAVQLAFTDAQRIFLERYRANPKVRIVVGGYSAGAVAAALFRQWLQQNYPDNYLCSFSLGDPTRPAGGTFHGGVATAGRGIADMHFGDVNDPRHCWLAQPGDMYTSVPNNDVGDIMQSAYLMVTKVEMKDFLGTAMAIAQQIPTVMSEAGISLPSVFGALAAGPAGILGMAPGLLMGGMMGLIGGLGGGGGIGANPTGVAAATQAAIIALKFMAANPPTGPHITYEFGEVWPGQTYLGLGIQHVRDWAGRTPVLT